MARHPASDERSVLGPAAKPRKGERFLVYEIARMLRCRPRLLFIFLRDLGMVRKVALNHGRGPKWVTTARGVQLAIVHFRGIQGERLEKGKHRSPKALFR